MSTDTVDVALVGAGIMSATLGALIHEIDPSLSIVVFERLDRAAAESSDAWNNAGTGHAGYCELNYTPSLPGGKVDCSKAIAIAKQFAMSLELWRSLVERGDLPDPSTFIRTVPHVSFVTGEEDVAFLRARLANLAPHPAFRGMDFSGSPDLIARWCPLVMEGRDRATPVAATRMADGTDVNFGVLTCALLTSFGGKRPIQLSHEVLDLRRDDGAWAIDVRDLVTEMERTVRAKLVFIGAGGYSLPLLEKSGIPEVVGYGGFPVSGQWLRCTNREVIERHHAKVYGRADVGAPPMSVPHLDSRWIDGNKELLFGPYAGFTTKFLKEGSWLDLLRSIGIDNAGSVMSAGLENIDLTRYLVGEAMLSIEERVERLRHYYPAAEPDDWEVQIAGQRVQIIKGDGKGRGELKFGTEVVTSADGSISGLLGASPGASTAVAIMVDLIGRCFPKQWEKTDWRGRLARVMPSLA